MKNLSPVYSNRGGYLPFFYRYFNNECSPITSYPISDGKQMVNIFSGSSLSLNVKFPFSLNEVTFSIVQAKPDILQNCEISYTDEFNATVTITPEISAALPLGDKNRIRFGVTFADGTQKNYNNIWIKVE